MISDDKRSEYFSIMEQGAKRLPANPHANALKALIRFIVDNDESLNPSDLATLLAVGSTLIGPADAELDAALENQDLSNSAATRGKSLNS